MDSQSVTRKNRRVKSEIERFWAKVEKTDTCWLWSGISIAQLAKEYEYAHISVAKIIKRITHKGID